MLLRQAYQLPFEGGGDIVIGGPDWIDEDRFDIEARADVERITREVLRPMWRNLLADRFTLQAHMETRDFPIYELVMARDDGRLGPQLRAAAVDCDAPRPAVNGEVLRHRSRRRASAPSAG